MRSASTWPRLAPCPSTYVRLAAARRAAEAPLPFPAASLTRKALDTALIAEAIAAGVRVERGRSVQSLSRTTTTSGRLRSTTAPPVKLQPPFSPRASTICAATAPEGPSPMGRLQDVLPTVCRADR
jgi:hypothetical protein